MEKKIEKTWKSNEYQLENEKGLPFNSQDLIVNSPH